MHRTGSSTPWAKRGVFFGMMAAVGLLMVFPREGWTTDAFALYQSAKPQLPVKFEYPADWQVEESSGSQEAYAQVQVYGPSSLEPRLRTYLVVRAVPSKTGGGRYASLEEMISAFRDTLQPGLRIDGTHPAQVAGGSATQVEVSGQLWLPWESPKAVPVPVKSQRVFLERGGRFYEFAWMATPEVSGQVGAAFSRLLDTFTVITEEGGS